MHLDFGEALQALGPDAPVRLAREMTPPARYLFNGLLPERSLPGYVAEHGNMVIRSTMAGLVGMDSPYPQGGYVEAAEFIEKLAKVANEVTLNEKTQRMLQERVNYLRLSGQSATQALAEEVLNFTNKVILQPHYDTAEWLRGQALVTGGISWKFGGTKLTVDYGIPADNKLTNRTGTASYGGSASKFWDDVREARRKLRYNLRGVWAHPETIDLIISNPANSLAIISQSGFNVTVQRRIARNGMDVAADDVRDSLTLVSYDTEGEVFDPSTRKTQLVDFMPRGKLLFVGQNTRSAYRVGEGSTPDPEADRALGYTHIGPTVEGGGAPGRWADVFTPERKRYQLVGQGVTNLLPVIEAPEKIVIASTNMEP